MRYMMFCVVILMNALYHVDASAVELAPLFQGIENGCIGNQKLEDLYESLGRWDSKGNKARTSFKATLPLELSTSLDQTKVTVPPSGEYMEVSAYFKNGTTWLGLPVSRFVRGSGVNSGISYFYIETLVTKQEFIDGLRRSRMIIRKNDNSITAPMVFVEKMAPNKTYFKCDYSM